MVWHMIRPLGILFSSFLTSLNVCRRLQRRSFYKTKGLEIFYYCNQFIAGLKSHKKCPQNLLKFLKSVEKSTFEIAIMIHEAL